MRPHTAAVTARAHANIALVKYWGKRDRELNLPAAGSLSLTLAALTTTTTVRFDPALDRDRLSLDGRPETGSALTRLSAWLDLVRARAGISARAEVVSANDFPTASGLASSASAYAALALAATRAAGLDLDPRALTVLARRGSGSAARSIHGGFVRMHAGDGRSSEQAFAAPLDAAADWPLRMVIAVVGGGRAKAHGSRDAMDHCAATSPLYPGWLACVPGDLARAEAAIAGRDLVELGQVAEASALAMHAAAMASRPAVLYWQPPTLACVAAVHELRDQGVRAFFTMDAGPHVKVLTSAAEAARVAARLGVVDGVTEVIESAPGGPAEVVP
ncbi:diphosphomevalonate decarboxylase [Haliangium sp.]|uniref:diphosphomevalonate decarboxylase n=1 Tax=Haliangium sp. TaxID=2663208 RepID=UPI003D0EAD5A